MSIDHFEYQYGWLASRYLCDVQLPEYPGRRFPTADHAYWALIYPDTAERYSTPIEWDPKTWLKVPSTNDVNRECTHRTVEEFKTNRSSVIPEVTRVWTMRKVTRAKFDQHPDLKEKLLKTKGHKLRYFNTWKDLFWGCEATPDGAHVGANWLGWILMDLRSNYLEEAG